MASRNRIWSIKVTSCICFGILWPQYSRQKNTCHGIKAIMLARDLRLKQIANIKKEVTSDESCNSGLRGHGYCT